MISRDIDYENYSKLVTIGKTDFNSFIDKYYSILKDANLSNLKEKDEYLESFDQNLNQIMAYSSLSQKSLNFLYKKTDKKTIKELQAFYLINEGELKDKTLIYFPMPHIDFLLNIRIIEDLVEKFIDNYNIVIIDNTISFFSETTYTKEQYDQLLLQEITEFFTENSLNDTEKNFNTICYGSLFLFNVLKANPNLYDKFIMYAPMLSLIQNGDSLQKILQLNPEVLPCEGDMIEFYIYTYLLQIISGNKIVPFVVSKNTLLTNFTNFKTIYQQFIDQSITNLDGLNEAKMILAEKDAVILHENSLSDYAADSRILEGADHLSFLINPSFRSTYLSYLEELMS